MSEAKRACLAAVALALGALLAGCVVIPYTPKAESRHDTTAIAHPERLRLSAGRRKLLAGFEHEVVERDARVQPVPGQTVLDIASPDGELTLERLLDPATRARIAPLALDYLVFVGNPVDKVEDQFGGMAFLGGFYGLAKGKGSTSLWTAVIDAKELSLVRQSTSKATGTSGGIGLFYGLFVTSDTREGALRDAVTRVVETIAAARPSGPVRVAFLAVEPIGDAAAPIGDTPAPIGDTPAPIGDTPAPIGGEHLHRWSLQQYPPFREAPKPPAGQGLVYVYVPISERLCLDEATVQTGWPNAAVDVSRVWCGGYYPLYLPAGSASLMAVSRHADVTLPLYVRVREGERRYVRLVRDMKIGVKPSWKPGLVEEAEAVVELSQCRRMPSAYGYDLETRRRAEEGEAYDQLELARLLAKGVTYADGHSVPQDRVEAYKWYSIVKAAGGGKGAFAAEQRDELAAGMDAAQVAEAKRRAQAWRAAFVPRGPEPAEPSH